MRFSWTIRALLVFFCVVSFSQGAFAQKYEIYPYAGGFWPMKIDEFKLMDQFMWGLKGGYYLSDHVQLEGNFGYLNHFKFEDVNIADFVDLNNITVITVTNTAATKSAKDGKTIPGTQSVVVNQLDPSRVTFIEPDPKQRGYLLGSEPEL